MSFKDVEILNVKMDTVQGSVRDVKADVKEVAKKLEKIEGKLMAIGLDGLLGGLARLDTGDLTNGTDASLEFPAENSSAGRILKLEKDFACQNVEIKELRTTMDTRFDGMEKKFNRMESWIKWIIVATAKLEIFLVVKDGAGAEKVVKDGAGAEKAMKDVLKM
ncbi:hypothetical protein EV426DRAFT_704000 [Tirmania nivea]|nr:hypothetical protein EV426DRAFT_704000 [Tirmania nivea]